MILTNNQNVALTNISITANSPFSQVNTCGTSIAAKAQCKITITFSPTVTGTQSGTVTVSYSASGSPQTIAVKGTGINPVTFSSGSLNFGTVPVATSSSPMNTCPSTVAAGGSCTITVTFTPHVTGNRSAFVKVIDSASTSPQSVKLAGTGN